MVCLREMFHGEIIFHFKKETEKIVLSQMKGLTQTSSGLISTRFSIIHKTSFWGAWNIAHHMYNTLKNNKLKVNGFLKENKLACFTISKDSY